MAIPFKQSFIQNETQISIKRDKHSNVPLKGVKGRVIEKSFRMKYFTAYGFLRFLFLNAICKIAMSLKTLKQCFEFDGFLKDCL